MRISIIFLFLAASSFKIAAQNANSNRFKNCFQQEKHAHEYEFAKGNTNELQAVFSGLFLFYKFAISSQDYNKCTFTPSCSEYGLLSVKKHGVIIGMLATIDRLQRCNGLSPTKYDIDLDARLLIDNP
jgi:putative component of membrane protein insertase Oxa1/YidC/SpoIIIJ protein YidD